MAQKIIIDSLAYRGYGVGRIGGRVVFVPFAAPQDVLNIEIVEEKKGFSFGKIVDIVEPSSLRQKAVCGVFTKCGGCHWLHLKYEEQLRWKSEILRGFLRKALPHDFESVRIVPSVVRSHYRSRAQFHIDGRKWGFFRPMTHDVEDIEACPLLENELNSLLATLRRANLPRSAHTVELTLDSIDRKCVAVFHVVENDGFDWKAALRSVDALKGFEVYQKKRGDKGGKRRTKIAGSGCMDVSYEASGIEFSANGASFTQVNIGQNRELIKEVLSACSPVGDASIADLYCGAGNFSLPLGRAGAKVAGLDFSAGSIEAARANSAKNGVKARFYRVEAGNFGRYLEKHGRDVVLLDPPREGGLKAVQSAARFEVSRIVYVSCSPPTLGRDVDFLLTKGYVLKGVSVVDMFPQTYHIEAVVTMERG